MQLYFMLFKIPAIGMQLYCQVMLFKMQAIVCAVEKAKISLGSI
jgi:hypothetical protein